MMCFRDFLTEKQCFFFFLRRCFFCFLLFASSVFCASVSFPLLLPVCCFAVFLNFFGLPRLFCFLFSFLPYRIIFFLFLFCRIAFFLRFLSLFASFLFFFLFVCRCFRFFLFCSGAFFVLPMPTRLQSRRHLRGLMPVMFWFISVFIPFVFYSVLFCVENPRFRHASAHPRFMVPVCAGVRRSAPVDFLPSRFSAGAARNTNVFRQRGFFSRILKSQFSVNDLPSVDFYSTVPRCQSFFGL